MTPQQREKLFKILKERFEANMDRHPGLQWSKVQAKLERSPEKIRSLDQMEKTGGEPDVIHDDGKAKDYVFYDCSEETPSGRRSLCYDKKALKERKEHKPKNSAVEMAEEMGVEILSEEQYRKLQAHGEFDTKTSSWIQTPAEIRKLGGALFCDRRYDTVFVYHNGAQSYYAVRGFRGLLRV